MKQKDYEIAKELKDQLSKVIQLLDFRVFGSRARGDADEYSDMDVFLKVNHLDKKLDDEIFNIVWEIGFKHFMVISPLIFTKHEIEETAMRSSPIVLNIMEEGIVV